MRRSFKKLAAVSIAACMVCSSVACTKEDNKETTKAADTVSTEADNNEDVTTTVADEKTTVADEKTTQADEKATEADATPENTEKTPDVAGSSIFVDIIDTVMSMKEYSAKYNVDVKLGDALESMGLSEASISISSETKANLKALEAWSAITATLNSDEMTMDIDALELAIKSDKIFVKTDALKAVAAALGGENVVEAMLAQFGVNMAYGELEKLLNFYLPMGVGFVDADALNELSDAYAVFMKKVLSNVDTSAMTVSDSKVSFAINAETTYAFLKAIADNLEKDDIEKVMDAIVVFGKKAIDFDQLETGVLKLTDEIVEGVKAGGMDLDDDTVAFLKETISESIESAQDQVNDLVQEMQDSLQEMYDGMDLDEIKKLVADKEACMEKLEESLQGATGAANVTIELSGDKVLVSMIGTMEVQEQKAEFKLSGEIAPEKVAVSEIKGAVSIKELVKAGVEIYQKISEMTQPE